MSRDQALAVAYGVKRRARRNRAEGGDVQPFIAPQENPAVPPRALREFVYDAVAQPVVDAYRAATGKMTEQEQRDFAITAAMGLIGPPAARGAMRPAQSAERTGIRAYHGSPHDFERFDLSKIGTGEGAQAYGHGLYFAENEATAKAYREALSGVPSEFAGLNFGGRSSQKLARGALDDALRVGLRGDDALDAAMKSLTQQGNMASASHVRQPYYDAVNALGPLKGKPWDINPGRMYEVNINAKPEQFLDWDAPLRGQSTTVGRAWEKYKAEAPRETFEGGQFANPAGKHFYSAVFENVPGMGPSARSAVTDKLREAGIPGIRYLDEGSRRPGATSLTRQQVDTRLNILRDDLANAEARGVGNPEAMRRKISMYESELARHDNPTRNYVVFDDKLIDILRKYGVAALPASGLAAMSTDYQPRADGGRTVNDPAMRVAYEARRRAMGGRNMPMGSQQGSHRGPISSPVAGRTDHHPMNVDAGSYVLPADHVSSLGQGNTAAGMKVLDEMFGGAGPYGAKAIGLKRMPAVGKSARGKRAFADGGMVPEPVPINAAGGEYVITPEMVTAIGNGNIEEGHRTLDNWVITNRKQHVKTLQKLPGPAKD